MKNLRLLGAVGVFLLTPSAYAYKSHNWSVNPGGTAVTRDSAGWSTITNNVTAKKIANWVFCNNCDIDVSFDALRGVGVLTSGSTINLVNGVGGSVMSQVPISGAFPTSVALFGMGIADVNGSAVWDSTLQ